MTNTDLLPATVLRRKAFVYVRQSTQTQVQTNLESQRRQYDLVEEARRRGFSQVEVIDDDLGKSASGMVARPGFDLAFSGSTVANRSNTFNHSCGLFKPSARSFGVGLFPGSSATQRKNPQAIIRAA